MHESLPVKRANPNKSGIHAKNITSYQRDLEKAILRHFSRLFFEGVTYNPDLARPEIDSRHIEAKVPLGPFY